jgi:hypothetical protein
VEWFILLSLRGAVAVGCISEKFLAFVHLYIHTYKHHAYSGSGFCTNNLSAP